MKPAPDRRTPHPAWTASGGLHRIAGGARRLSLRARAAAARPEVATGGEREDPMARRTTHRSTAGKKLYAVRDSKGRFKDIQTYERAHRADLKKKSAAETKSRKKK